MLELLLGLTIIVCQKVVRILWVASVGMGIHTNKYITCVTFIVSFSSESQNYKCLSKYNARRKVLCSIHIYA